MVPILTEMRSAQAPDYTNMPIDQARRLFEIGAMAWNRDLPEMPAREIELEGVRCHLLNEGAGEGLIVFAHGGGWTFGSPESHQRFGRMLARAAGMPVLMPDYRMAPEHPAPAAILDMLAVIAAMPARPLVLAGDSAGANIALATALAGAQADALALIYGCFAPIFDTASHRGCGDGSFGLSTERMRWFWDNWLGATRDARAIPLDGELAGLPPVHMVAAGLDCLRDDSILLAEKLAAAGVPFRLDVVPGVVHGFLQMSLRLPPASEAIAEIGAQIRKTLG
jgi:acetyl esterase